MKVQLLDTASKEKKVVESSEVKFYGCGPTVYRPLHIGNWRTFILYDTLVRTLKYHGYKVNEVINITDVGHLTSDADEGEDKVEKQARDEGSSAKDITSKYTQQFLQDMDKLNFIKPTTVPVATEHIQEQIDMVKTLEDKGFTYKIDDGIYFDTSKFKDYGKMAKLDLDGQGNRIESNPQKKQPQDFALWKFSPKDSKRQMEWDSPWGVGFPGWHLECSAMALKYLGKNLDIHAGGIDHIPVHHTNEIAQSESANDASLAKIWLHGAFINTDGEKMSKSKENTVTIEQLEKRANPLAYRMLVLQSHYSTQASFTWDLLEAAQKRLMDIYNWAALRWQKDASSTEADIQKIAELMADNLNTPKVLGHISGIGVPSLELVKALDELLGLNIESNSKDLNQEQKELITKRAQAREDKDFDLADKLRQKLEQSGIELDDSQESIWRRTTF